MNDISELLYVADIENYELLFLNKQGMEIFQIDSILGHKCYKVLQGRDKPCEFCTNAYLKEGENYTWEHTNELTNRHYLLKDRLVQWDGRRARMEIAFDTTKIENEKMQLKFTLEAEQMVTDCIGVLYRSKDIKKAIDIVLEKLGQFLDADRSYIFYIVGEKMCNEYEWCAKEIEPQKDKLQDIPLSTIERWIPKFDNKECIIITNLEDIKNDSVEEYEILKDQAVSSLVVSPLEQDGKLIGYLGVDNPPPDKLMNIATLLQTVCYFLLLANHQAENEQELSRLSYYDTLTSFYNRNRYIQDTEALNNSNVSVGVIYLDVNGLKDVNDQLGHEEGDRLLVRCANRMNNLFDQANYYRIGGDEFVIVCPQIPCALFEKKVAELKKRFQFGSDCKVAIGANWEEAVKDINKVISKADANMYVDKKEFYRKNPTSKRYRHHNDEILHLTDLEGLEKEIESGRFIIYIQPQFSLIDQSVMGAEALIRYQLDGKIIPPNTFIPLLEDTGLIDKIDTYVFTKICEKIRKWLDEGKKLFPICINFSSISLRNPLLKEDLQAICKEYQVPLQYLVIEITERISEDASCDIKKIIPELRKAGFTVAIDDFGTDSANLAMLSEVDFDILKIDKSLVNNIATNQRTLILMQHISKISHDFGFQMVAEGIETKEQWEILHLCCVENGQGYYFSRPIEMEIFEKHYLK